MSTIKKIFSNGPGVAFKHPIQWMRWMLVFLTGVAVGLWVMYAITYDTLAQCQELAKEVLILLTPKTSL